METNISKFVPTEKSISTAQGEVKPKLTPLNVHGHNRINRRTYHHISTVSGPFYLFRWTKNNQVFCFSRLELENFGISTDKLPSRFSSDKTIIQELPTRRKLKKKSNTPQANQSYLFNQKKDHQ